MAAKPPKRSTATAKPAIVSKAKAASGAVRPRGELRRKALLDAAQQVFLEHGYANAGIEDVIARVGGSKASLYSYFGSKEGLFQGMVEDSCAQFLRDVAIPTTLKGPLDKTLEDFGLRFFRMYTEPRRVSLIRTIISEATRFPALAKQLYDSGPLQVRVQLSTFFALCHKQGAMHAPDPDLAAIQFITLMKGHCQFRALFGLPLMALPISEVEFVRYSVQMFLHGVEKPGAAPAPRRKASGR